MVDRKGRTMSASTMLNLECITAPSGMMISYATYGSGPPLVLVHGCFSDHETNWQKVRASLESRFRVYAIARRGRGMTSATEGHTVWDEASDVASLLRHVGEPVFLLGHSYGALCALEAARLEPTLVRKLVLYEAPAAQIASATTLAELNACAAREDWDDLVETFMRDVLQVPQDEVNEIRASPFWAVWTADAPATLGDLRAFDTYRFEAARFASLDMPVQLLIGTESPRDVYLTDALLSVLPEASIAELAGQAHEGMTTAPEQFVEVVVRFFDDSLLSA
jgi:pimeloyl-ACP methyl ester carboxylesterase